MTPVSRVLVPMDGSPMAERALEYALGIHPDAEITVFHVAGVPTPFMAEAASIALEDDLETAAAAHAEQIFDRAHEIAAEHGAEIDTETAIGSPIGEIVDRADDADVVVIGSHGSSMARRILVGNVAEAVVRRSSVPVTVVR